MAALSAIDAARLATGPTVEVIARDANRVAGLPRETLLALLLRCSAAQAAIYAELVRTSSTAVSELTAAPAAARLLDAKQMAEHLQVPESWVRSEARAGRIPKRMVGRYVRFDPSEVERALSQRDG
jgi:excisionase family DNA binding protein